MRHWRGAFALLPGVLLLLCNVVPTQQLELNAIPNIKPYPALKPLDSGYPGNIPSDVPAQLESAPAVLSQGPAGACPISVSAVLAANKRTLLATHLAATPLGQQILSGSLQATILAPSDESLAQTLAEGDNGLSGPTAQATLALYHVLQGKHNLADLGRTSGLWWNSSLTDAACPTASQTVTLLTAQQGAEFGGPTTFARSASNTVRVVRGDLDACNSIVHLVDRALQPCCTSLFEQLPVFSLVKIQPSYFDGYAAQEPVGNADNFNRRLFEEAMVDFLLFTSSLNETKTLLWPSPTAWDNIKLANLLPSLTLDVTTRTRAMRLLALYAISYAQSILPQDIPGADGTAPAIKFPFVTALRNNTANSVWSCPDALTVAAPAWASPVYNGQLPTPSPPASPAATPKPPAAATPSPAPAQGGISPSPAPGNPLPAPAAAVSPSPAPTVPGGETKAPGVQPQQPPVTRRRLQGQEQQQEQELEFDFAAVGLDVAAGEGQQGLRKLQAAVMGPSKTVNVVDSHETCENIRVLVVDAVPVPCNFASLVTQYEAIQSRMDTAYIKRDFKSLDAAFYDWLVRNGIIKPGEKISQGAGGGSGGRGSGSTGSSAGALGMTGLQRQLQTWLGVAVLAWLSWQYVV
uniref:FAS1 domain-containing protein n=1 Tax=Tetradesmus obliquus TaxID=3088 RepID=A0A383VJW9_TETOB|eukprot:jgi/Sobl393_1/15407/SZX65827.1